MAKRTPKPTPEQDRAAFVGELSALFVKYNGRLWKVRNAEAFAGIVTPVVTLIGALLPQAPRR